MTIEIDLDAIERESAAGRYANPAVVAELVRRLQEAEKALCKIAAWGGEWGAFPETSEAWRAMAVVTAREAVPNAAMGEPK